MIFYRAQKICFEEELSLDAINFHYSEYRVIKETPKGYWLYISYNKKRFMVKNAKARFAAPSKEAALSDFLHRARRSIAIQTFYINFTKLAIKKAEELLK